MKDILTSEDFLCIKNKYKDIFCILEEYQDADSMKDRNSLYKAMDLLNEFVKYINK